MLKAEVSNVPFHHLDFSDLPDLQGKEQPRSYLAAPLRMILKWGQF